MLGTRRATTSHRRGAASLGGQFPHLRCNPTRDSLHPEVLQSYGYLRLLSCFRPWLLATGKPIYVRIDPGAKSIYSKSAKGIITMLDASSPCISSMYVTPSKPLQTLSRFVAAG